MPLFNLVCPGCGDRIRRILKTFGPDCSLPCNKCKAVALERDPQPPTVQVMESLDSGFQPRRVVRLKDAERLHKERAANDPRKKF